MSFIQRSFMDEKSKSAAYVPSYLPLVVFLCFINNLVIFSYVTSFHMLLSIIGFCTVRLYDE